MTATFYGADVVELRALADRFDSSAAGLRATKNKIGNGIQISAWVGPFAVKFRAQWASQSSIQVENAARALNNSASALRRNADEQEGASSAAGGGSTFGGISGIIGRMVGGDNPAANPGLFGGKFAWLGGIENVTTFASDVHDAAEQGSKVFRDIANIANTADRSAGAVGEAIDNGLAQGSKLVGAVSGFMKIPVVGELSEGLGVVGAGFAIAHAADVWTDPSSTTWNKTETTVTAALAIASAIPFAAPVAAPLGLAWTVGTSIYDANHVAIDSFVQGTAQKLAVDSAAIERQVAPVVEHAVSNAVAAGEKTAAGIINSATGLFGAVASIF